MLCQVIYSSRATQSMDSAALEEILDDARSGNAQRGITGALIYVGDVFLQVLEGECESVDSLVAQIGKDSRHGDMKVFHRAEITERAFSDWRMAYLSASAADLAHWAGLEGSTPFETLLEHIHANEQRVPRILLSISEAISRRPDAGG